MTKNLNSCFDFKNFKFEIYLLFVAWDLVIS